MDRISAFFDMGGYGAFVWPAYATTAVVLVALLVISRRALGQSEAALAALQAESREPEAGGTTSET